ncbi:alpha-L-rhamnosidase-related protein [Deinococcus aetherius]|uniref:alpha-L-rhamnosidase-related protein n=1 Tax=Deinococcus aetherius TaxID=200252 RepID=UPI00222F655A|nr:alpha-L-rhamnosidase C-terminal domain-containing protein [Deinococcus aetherius]
MAARLAPVPFLLDVPCEGGCPDVAYRLLFRTECPPWLYEVERGATTIWENWRAIMPDGRVQPVSYNHYAFGCGLTSVRTSHDTGYGPAAIRWSRVPVGTRATVHLPGPAERVRPDGRPLKSGEGCPASRHAGERCS